MSRLRPVIFDWASVLLSVAALGVAGASLWFAALRRATVTAGQIEAHYALQSTLWRAASPIGTAIDLQFYLANSGASGTVVERFAITNFREVNNRPAIWSGLSAHPPAGHNDFDGVSFPLALERDSTTTGEVRRELEPSTDNPIADDEEFARRLAGLRSVSVTLEWTYRHAGVFRPSRRKAVPGREVVTIDAAEFRQRAIDYWRSNEAYAPLAALAEGRDAG